MTVETSSARVMRYPFSQVIIPTSRNLGEIYTNDTGKLMMVICTIGFKVTINAYAEGDLIGESPVGTQQTISVTQINGLSNEVFPASAIFIVVPGNSYKVGSVQTNVTVAYGNWVEIV